jgi:hypothetical protein
VGEGVLLECLEHPSVEPVLIVTRKHDPAEHPQLKECIVPDFLDAEKFSEQLTGYSP